MYMYIYRQERRKMQRIDLVVFSLKFPRSGEEDGGKGNCLFRAPLDEIFLPDPTAPAYICTKPLNN